MHIVKTETILYNKNCRNCDLLYKQITKKLTKKIYPTLYPFAPLILWFVYKLPRGQETVGNNNKVTQQARRNEEVDWNRFSSVKKSHSLYLLNYLFQTSYIKQIVIRRIKISVWPLKYTVGHDSITIIQFEIDTK